MGHYVYKYVYNNEIIYIGKNDTNLYSRLKQHGKCGDNIPEEGWDEINNSDIFYCELANATMSDVVESELIRRYKPKYNKAKMSEWSGVLFVEPEWKKAFEKNNEEALKEKDAEISSLKSKLIKCQKELYECQKELNNLSEYKFDYLQLNSRYNNVLKQINDLKNNIRISNDDEYSFEDICNWYKQPDSIDGVFEAIAYDYQQNVISYKTIYIDAFGELRFEFAQMNRKPVQGSIFINKKETVKRNYNVLRQWINVGANTYIKVV